jgi:hypothetical protein
MCDSPTASKLIAKIPFDEKRHDIPPPSVIERRRAFDRPPEVYTKRRGL